MNTTTEKNNIRLTKDNMALGYNASSKEKELFVLKEAVSHLEKSARERSQKADGSPNPDTESVVAKLNSEIAKVKAENASQQDVFSRKIDDGSS